MTGIATIINMVRETAAAAEVAANLGGEVGHHSMEVQLAEM